MEQKLAIIGIFVSDTTSAAMVNQLLHEYSHCIIGRMGIPYHEKKVSIMSVVLDAQPDEISSLSGKLGRIPNVTVKTMQGKL